MVKEVKDMEAITSGLTRTVLGDNAGNTELAVETSTKVDDMDVNINRMGETLLEKGDKQSLANLPAAKEKVAEEIDRELGLGLVCIAKKQAAEKDEEGIDTLVTACGG